MNPGDATREVMWNISHGWIMYLLLVPTLAVAAYGINRRVRLWRRACPIDRLDRPWERLRHVWNQAILQRRTMRDRYAGIFHAFIFWGLITLTIATTVVMVHHDFGLPIMKGRFYLYFQSLFVDVLGGLATLGIVMAGYRRWVSRPRALVYHQEATWILIVSLAIMISGFLIEGWRIVVTEDPWGAWSPFGYLVGKLSSKWMGGELLQQAHQVLWWGHLVLVFGFIAWAPYTKLIHPLTSLLNVYASHLGPVGGSLKSIDFDSEQALGVNQLSRFTWKDLLDLDACTECGRCHEVCPANDVGKALSPRDLILDLRDHMHSEGVVDHPDERLKERGLTSRVAAAAPERLWQCTTCAACVEVCPVQIEQLPKIVDLRRYQVMEEADVPPEIQAAMASLESRGHPFAGSRFSRLDWKEGLDVPIMGDGAEAPEVLLWVGCGGALLERNQKSIRALAELLNRAGVRYAILGREEKCTGDPARRVGNEFLFEQLALENIQTLDQHQVKTIVTSCPHCFNSFKNEYPRLGGTFEVVHHSEFIGQLIESGRLTLKPSDQNVMTFHDPCYLSRHNGQTLAPRTLLNAVSSAPLQEPMRTGRQSFCCGGGGGMSFVDEPAGQRVNQARSRELVATGAQTVAVGCPFCTTMLEDGIRSLEGTDEVTVKELSEIVLEHVEASAGSRPPGIE